MDTLLQDLRYAARALVKSPGFTLAAILSLALGIGANTAIFSAIDAALLRPLPVDEPGRLALVTVERGEAGVTPNFSHPRFLEFRGGTRAFSGMAAFSPQPLNLATGGGAVRLEGEIVSPDYFQVVGVRPALGRGFVPGEGAATEAVLSHELWTRRFGADPGVVGRAVSLNGKPFTVAGVAPEGFRGMVRGTAPALWIPLEAQRVLATAPDQVYLDESNISWLNVVGRLAPGVTLAQAQAALQGVQRGMAQRDSVVAGWRMLVEPGARGYGYLLSGTEKPLYLLLATVAIVLLIACANVANLLLARAAARRRELAIRASLGARRGRIVRQLLTESLLLAGLGGAAGLLVAIWTGNLLLRFPPPSGVPVRLDTGPDARVLGFTLAVSLLVGLVLGLVPGLRASRPELVSALKADARAGGPARLGLRGLLVAGQVALAVVLLAGAGLLVRTLRNLEHTDLGYGARSVLLASVDLEGTGWEPERGRRFYAELLERVGAEPGVDAASLATTITPNPGGSNVSGVTIPGYTPAGDELVSFDLNVVAPGYFATLDIPVRGRDFTPADREGAPRVAVVNETMAKRYWPNGNAVGQRIVLGTDSTAPSVEVVGIARDGKYRTLREEPRANAWFSVLQSWRPTMTLLVRSRRDPAELAAAVRREVAALDPRVPVFEVRTLKEHIGVATAQERLAATLVSLFGALALVVAAVGIFGVLAWLVVERTHELGVRMALGATRASVIRLVLARGLALAGAGAAVGVAAAFGLTRLVSSLLYGVSPSDPLAFALATALLLGTAALASYLPAARAARVDPMVALRSE
ncbi:MAG TPA: ABC transporter permease [Longimicrobium sp.]|jgi:predicted permease